MKTTGYVAALALSFLAFNTSIAQSDLPSASQHKSITKKLNLNTATLTQLTHAFRGIGPKRAQAIITYRQQHGHFKSVTELAEVKGIGQSFVAQHLNELNARFSTESL